MTKSELKNLVGEDMGCWEIISADYDRINKCIILKLNEFVWRGVFHGRDYKEYLNNYKTIKILDKYSFKYYEDNKLVNSPQQYVENLKGVNMEILKNIFKYPYDSSFSELSFYWKNLMIKKGFLDAEEYKEHFFKELKKELVNYYKNAKNYKDIELVKFMNEIYDEVNSV